jgi:hypothetical protein
MTWVETTALQKFSGQKANFVGILAAFLKFRVSRFEAESDI